MEFCFFYFLCLFIIYFLSKNLISARLITQCWLICVTVSVSVSIWVFFLIRLGRIGSRIRPRSGWTGPVKTWRGGFGAKKNHLLNEPSLGNMGGPTGWIWASKKPGPNPTHCHSYSQLSCIIRKGFVNMIWWCYNFCGWAEESGPISRTT